MTVGTKTKREKLAEREDAIVSAATEAFLEKGMSAAKMAEIAASAGVAEGTLYLYFKNKEALFAAVVARHWESLTEGATAAIAKADSPDDQLEALARYTLRRILADWKLFELSFVLHYPVKEDGVGSDRRGYVRIFDQIVARGIDRGTFAPEADPRLVRDLFFGTIEYAVRSILQTGKNPKLEPVVIMLLTAVRAVLKPGQGQARTPDHAERIEAAVTRLEKLAER
ncbi:TetR/AcrR family transcriptional regulator [Parvularcula sp. ZS-1/3]|uniref:TetR/AcrR family transcriptional regulator n=1 Tax=Parvularcula mediterranea TaxID=2732508 RepID=A0A7Y3RLG1_9PROT|nr:TetR/AcrR family transcriptional regulator [Parvularcula mediterranea]NNU16180.1 TetR/AcrR family transcriptional regulator [Parvularcula mediterranea]